jgi:glycosyltransferase involved in cell wall biosynthesis
MKILMISNMLFPLGGVETYMISVGNQLSKMGHQVEYFGMYDKRNIVGNSFNIYKKNMDFRKKNIRMLKYPIELIYSFESKRRIKKLIKLMKPDIVHLNTINYNITPSIITVFNKYKIPVVKTVHDAQIACPNHRLFIEHRMEPCTRCITGKYINCVKNKCVWNSRTKSILAAIESYFYRLKRTYHKIDKYILPSKFMMDIHSKNGIPIEKMQYLINFSRLNRNMNFNIEKDNYILYFGRISPEKGIRTFLKVIKKLSHIRFKIVGTGPLIKELDGIANLEYLGFKSGDELNSIISKALFSVYPSEWYENSPLSVLESQALGTPVIASNIGGIPELITESTGILFKSGDANDLEEKILSLYDSKSTLENMIHACINNAFVLNEHQYTEKLIEIYNNTISERGLS